MWGERLPEEISSDYQLQAADDPFGYRLRMDYACSDDRFGLSIITPVFCATWVKTSTKTIGILAWLISRASQLEGPRALPPVCRQQE